jgi:DNA-binding GntR family transcriptional regulator
MISKRRINPPLYQELRNRLAKELAAGVYPVGSRFPSEQELCERHKLGRHTVREALRGLQEAGMLSRHAGSGTVVTAIKPPEVYSYRIDSVDNLTEYAQQTVLHKQQEGIVILRDRLARTLGAPTGSRWLRIAGLRQAIGQDLPIAWTEIYVAEPYIGIRESIAGTHRAIYQQLSEQFGLQVAEVERHITAVAMPGDLAEALRCEADSPALMERRRYWSPGNELFEISLSFHPGNRFSQTIRLKRES